MDKRAVMVFLAVLLFLSTVAVVSAEDLLSRTLKPFSGFDLSNIYNNAAYQPFIDFVLYAIFFIAIAQFALASHFKDRPGKAIVSVIGIMLALAMTVWSKNSGFSILQLAPIAVFLFALVLGWGIYKIFTGFGMSLPRAWAFGYIFVYLLIRNIPAIDKLINDLSASGLGAWLGTILDGGFIVAIVMVVITFFGAFRGQGGGGGRGGDSSAAKDAAKMESEDVEPSKKELKKAEEAERAAVFELQDLDNLLSKDITDLNNLKILLQQLNSVMRQLIEALPSAVNERLHPSQKNRIRQAFTRISEGVNGLIAAEQATLQEGRKLQVDMLQIDALLQAAGATETNLKTYNTNFDNKLKKHTELDVDKVRKWKQEVDKKRKRLEIQLAKELTDNQERLKKDAAEGANRRKDMVDKIHDGITQLRFIKTKPTLTKASIAPLVENAIQCFTAAIGHANKVAVADRNCQAVEATLSRNITAVTALFAELQEDYNKLRKVLSKIAATPGIDIKNLTGDLPLP